MTWQPIDTAPKTGWIMVTSPHWNIKHPVVECFATIVRWSPRLGLWLSEDGGDVNQPTHWQPLPEPPQ